MRPTLVGVARLAGVSRSTASRALLDDPRVLPETRAKVLEAAQALSYHPNRMASALRTRRTGLLGLVVNSTVSATFNKIMSVLQSDANALGYQMLVCTTDGDPVRESAFLDTVRDCGMDGVIIAGSGQNLRQINALHESGTAVVAMNREIPGVLCPVVIPDYRQASLLATELLLAQGHRRIAFLGGPDTVTSGRQAYDGYVESLSGAGLMIDPRVVSRVDYQPDAGSGSVSALGLDRADGQRPTALVGANHDATLGLLGALAHRRVEVPSDLSLVCTEDAPWFPWWSPAVTAVDIHPVNMAERAMALLLEQLPPGSLGAATVVVPDLAAPVVRERSSIRSLP